MNPQPILVASGITKRYGGVAALTDVGFQLNKGEILGLCGENGAGKSTLIKILGGIVIPDDGSLSIGGAMVQFGRRPDPSLLSIVHQELSIIPHLTVLDNLMMGRRSGRGFYLRSRFMAETRQLLQLVGLEDLDPSVLAGTLTLAEQQLIEIARGLASNSQVLLLDEPTATLSDAEIGKVFAVLRQLRNRGATIVIVSHRLGEIFSLTDRITVFRNGQHIFTQATSDLGPRQLVRAMIGRDAEHTARAGSGAVDRTEAARISATAVTMEGSFGPIDLDVWGGEIVALVGQLGSGANVVLETIAGVRRPTHGGFKMDGQGFKPEDVSEAYKEGVAYVAEDRAGRGVFLTASIEVNMTSQILDQISPGGLVSPKLSRQRSSELARAFQIDPNRLSHSVATLSGGNQQKVSLAKAAACDPKLLLLNEPTRGVDVGARSEIYARLRKMADAGLAIVFYSTDLEEVMEIADRIITFYRGQIVRNLDHRAATADDILQDILHGQHEVIQ